MALDQSELALQTRLSALLGEMRQSEIVVRNCTDEKVHDLGDFLRDHPFRITAEDKVKKWRKFPEAGTEIIGGATKPDIILSSTIGGSECQRIIIEVKKHSRLTHTEPAASQIARYFLYLLYTSLRYSEGKNKACVRRGVFLAAPKKWFAGKHSAVWKKTYEIYEPLAQQFDIPMGEIYEEDLPDTD
jgi:hypothetical protein